MKILTYREFNEGVSFDSSNDNFIFNFSVDNTDDLMSLKFSKNNKRITTHNDSEHANYYAYSIGDSKNVDAKDLIKKIKYLDDSINPLDLDLLVKKAVLGLHSSWNLNSFDTIIYPQSGSKILNSFVNAVHNKAGNTVLIDEAFVKSTPDNIKFDWQGIEKISDEKTKKDIIKLTDKINNSKTEFKMKDIYARYRKYIQDFLIFNDKNTKILFNAITDKRVILIDDYKTSGISLKEMNTKILELNPKFLLSTILIKIS